MKFHKIERTYLRIGAYKVFLYYRKLENIINITKVQNFIFINLKQFHTIYLTPRTLDKILKEQSKQRLNFCFNV